MSEANFLLYEEAPGVPRLVVRIEDETVWLSQAQMAELFQTTKQNISLHIRNVFEEGELNGEATVKDYLTVQSEGDRQVERSIAHYNLDVIISVGYRVRSHVGTRFRIWATRQLRDFLVKGFLLDDQRFKSGGSERYFEELLQRIRDIRSSEKVFWRKVLDIYATSLDYNPAAEATEHFFATVQNKMHWAAHGHTAAEIVVERADASKPLMGMTNIPGARAVKSDARVAKNYLSEAELGILNRIVNSYLEFAELQALSRRTMTMAAWVAKLDDFLRLTDREILTHPGSISKQDAIRKADLEFEQWRALEASQPSPVEEDFARALEEGNKPKRDAGG